MVLGHTPTVGEQPYPASDTDTYKWGRRGAVPWFKTQFDQVANGLDSYWTQLNYSKAPTWGYGGSSSPNEIRWASSAAGCPASGWAACITYDGAEKLAEITFNPNWNWCQASVNSTCLDFRLAALHELGHAAGLARANMHSLDTLPLAASVMQLNIPPGVPSDPGMFKLGHCDTLELLREYDMEGYQNPVSRCVDHLPSSIQSGGKLITGNYLNGTTVSVCVGEAVAMNGSIQLNDEPADNELGALADNGLTSRTIRL